MRRTANGQARWRRTSSFLPSVDRVLVSRTGTVQEVRVPAKSAPEGIVKVPWAGQGNS